MLGNWRSDSQEDDLGLGVGAVVNVNIDATNCIATVTIDKAADESVESVSLSAKQDSTEHDLGLSEISSTSTREEHEADLSAESLDGEWEFKAEVSIVKPISKTVTATVSCSGE